MKYTLALLCTGFYSILDAVLISRHYSEMKGDFDTELKSEGSIVFFFFFFKKYSLKS